MKPEPSALALPRNQTETTSHQCPYMDASRFAKLSIDNYEKVKIAAIHPDFV